VDSPDVNVASSTCDQHVTEEFTREKVLSVSNQELVLDDPFSLNSGLLDLPHESSNNNSSQPVHMDNISQHSFYDESFIYNNNTSNIQDYQTQSFMEILSAPTSEEQKQFSTQIPNPPIPHQSYQQTNLTSCSNYNTYQLTQSLMSGNLFNDLLGCNQAYNTGSPDAANVNWGALVQAAKQSQKHPMVELWVLFVNDQKIHSLADYANVENLVWTSKVSLESYTTMDGLIEAIKKKWNEKHKIRLENNHVRKLIMKCSDIQQSVHIEVDSYMLNSRAFKQNDILIVHVF